MGLGGDSGAKVVSEGLLRCSWDWFLVDLGQFGTPKSINIGMDFVIYFVMCCLSLLERFGVDVGATVVSKIITKNRNNEI